MFNIFKFQLIKTSKEDIEKINSSFSNEIQKPWDPINQINIETLKNNIAEILSKFNSLKQIPDKPKKQKFYAILFAIFGIIFFSYLLFGLGLIDKDGRIGAILLLPFIPLGYVLGYYSNLSKDIIKIQIAQEKDYFYNPEKEPFRWSSLSGKFPELFRKGNKDQYVEDEFWGNISKNNKIYNFYSGLFSYTIETGHGKNRRSTTYNKHFFTIKLDKALNSRFHLYQESVVSKIGNFFSKKEIDMASNEFNKTFAFSYNGEKNEKALQIVKTLSPAVQTRLLDLNKQKQGTNILFSDGCVFFMFDNFLFKNMKTNLFKSCEIKIEDKEYLENQLNMLIDLSTQIVKYLD